MKADKVRFLKEKLLEWAKGNLRPFPWRRSGDPYKVLAAEILLQKTTAEQVKEIFEDFFEKFPSVEDLSAAGTEEIAEVVGVLGLRKRAAFLKATAAEIVEKHGGEVPQDAEALKSFKGVGDYGCNAVLCFAFGERRPVVDSNIARVLRRYFGLSGKRPPYADRGLWDLAKSIMPEEDPEAFNYGLLDLAAKHCSSDPSCGGCPLVEWCSFFR